MWAKFLFNFKKIYLAMLAVSARNQLEQSSKVVTSAF